MRGDFCRMKRIALSVCAVMLLCILFGCTAKKTVTPSDSVPEKKENVRISASAQPLVITALSAKLYGITAEYPKVTGSVSDDKINDLIYSTLTELADKHGSELLSLNYTICYNDHGIFSVLFEAGIKNTEGKRYSALTLNTAIGEKLPLNSNFKEESAWVDLSEFYIEASVRLKGTETFARLTVNNNKEYCLTENKLLVLYETYEYTYYSGGDTLFSVPYSLFDGLCGKGGAMAVICGEE